MFNVKQLKMNKFIKYIWQLIFSTSNARPEVPSLRPCFLLFKASAFIQVFFPRNLIFQKVLRTSDFCSRSLEKHMTLVKASLYCILKKY